MNDRISATFWIETAFPLEQAAGITAGEQSTGTFVQMGTAYLNLLLSYCSSVITALAAYNARPTAVPAGGVPNFNETKNYLKRIEDCHKKKGLSKGR